MTPFLQLPWNGSVVPGPKDRTRANGAVCLAPLPPHGFRDRYLERRHRRIDALLSKFPQFAQKDDPTHIIRLDPISVFLMLYATFSFIAIIVLTNTPIVIFGPSTDLGTLAANYLLITAPVVGIAPLIVGGYIYDPKQLGPITRPVILGKPGFFGQRRIPDVTLIGLLLGLFGVIIVDYSLTYGGSAPTLSFWSTLTNKIAYADGGIFEEFIFRFAVFGAVNRFPGVGKVLLGNPIVFLGFTGPLDSAAFTLYHLKVYANSTLSLQIVFAESDVICYVFRGLKYPLWVGMVIHGLINWSFAP